MILLQHEFIADFSISRGRGTQQIGQSPRCVLSGCLNKISSCNSAARFLHFFCAGTGDPSGILHCNILQDDKQCISSIWCHHFRRCRKKHKTSSPLLVLHSFFTTAAKIILLLRGSTPFIELCPCRKEFAKTIFGWNSDIFKLPTERYYDGEDPQMMVR